MAAAKAEERSLSTFIALATDQRVANPIVAPIPTMPLVDLPPPAPKRKKVRRPKKRR